MSTAFKYTLAGIAAVLLSFFSVGLIHPEIEYESKIAIHASPEKSFQVFTDTSLMHQWLPGFKSFSKISGDPLTAGTKHLLVLEQEGKVYEITETITDVKPNQRYAFDAVNSVLKSSNLLIFEGDSSQTLLTVQTRARGNNLFLRSLFVFTKPLFQQQQDTIYHQLKLTIEKK
jgi:uncharacterized protein YndB with AHSA1/START domain